MWDNLCIKFINHQCEGDWLRWVCEVIIFSWLFLAKRAKENMRGVAQLAEMKYSADCSLL